MNEDLRIKKTKRNIYQALLKLMEQKAFENIKVSEICKEAMINRSTFYSHFEDKYTLIDTFIKDLQKELENELAQKKNITSFKEYYMEIIRLLLDEIYAQKSIYRTILINNRNSIFMDMLYDTIKSYISKRLKEKKMDNTLNIPNDFIIDFYLGAIMNTGLTWYKYPDRYSKEEILSYINKLIPNNIEKNKND